MDKTKTELILTCGAILTDVKKSWKTHNHYVMECYNGIHPQKLSCLSHILYGVIQINKRRYAPNHAKYDQRESERTYNSLWCPLEKILQKANPVKYRLEKKEASTDISNLKKSIRELDSQNIFYTWRYKQPMSYMFFMEEDVAMWKYYNPSASLSPKSLGKILFGASGAIRGMVSFEEKAGRAVKLSDVENSFGDFITGLISRMNPEVAKGLSVWVKGSDIVRYIGLLEDECKSLPPYAGVEVSEEFLQRIPENLATNLSKKAKVDISKENTEKEKGKTMDISELEASLVPQDGNLVRQRKTRVMKPKTKKTTGINAPVVRLPRSTPFANSNSFISFYRAVIRDHTEHAKFLPFANERHVAEKVLDVLLDNHYDGDIDFLKGWIKYFATSTLTGTKAKDTDNTSLTTLLSSFVAYKQSYVV